MNYLEKLDLFSSQIFLKKNKSYKYSTLIGLMTSFALYSILAILTISYLNKIKNNQLQSVIFSNDYEFNAPKFKFSN